METLGNVSHKIERIQQKYGDMNLIDMLHTFLAEEDLKRQMERIEQGRIGKYYPSSVGQCRRKVAYQMMGYPGKPKDGKSNLILDNGTSFHNRMEKYFEDMGIMIAPELRLKDEQLRISGRSDAIIWNFMKREEPEVDHNIYLYKPSDDDNNEDELVYEGPASDVLIVEFKSIGSKGWGYLPKTKAKKEHEMQLQLYFYLTGVRHGMVYYENKDTQEQKYYMVEYNQSIVDQVIADIKFIIGCIDNGKLPDREFTPSDFQCRYCDFRDICHPVTNAYNLEDLI